MCVRVLSKRRKHLDLSRISYRPKTSNTQSAVFLPNHNHMSQNIDVDYFADIPVFSPKKIVLERCLSFVLCPTNKTLNRSYHI